ncbi:thioredoxin domain-containing protein [Sphingomonas jejuensis]|nr:thioredoxin domain-containing protein [Sphingomonas jejuensis]
MPRFLLLSVAVLALGACGGTSTENGTAANTAAPTNASASAGNWAETVTKTADGGFLVGNPNAPVKLVEYASLTCHVCKDFAEAGYRPLIDNYVSKGTVSLELRNYVRDPIDLAASLLTRCQGAGPYLQLTEQTYDNQPALLEQAQNLSTETLTRIGNLPQAQQYAAIANELGLKDFYAQRGLGSQRADACLADEQAVSELVAMQRRANEEYQIPGTPAFLINGELQQVTNWQALEPLIRAAGG